MANDQVYDGMARALADVAAERERKQAGKAAPR